MVYGKTIARLWARCSGNGDGVIVGVAHEKGRGFIRWLTDWIEYEE